MHTFFQSVMWDWKASVFSVELRVDAHILSVCYWDLKTSVFSLEFSVDHTWCTHSFRKSCVQSVHSWPTVEGCGHAESGCHIGWVCAMNFLVYREVRAFSLRLSLKSTILSVVLTSVFFKCLINFRPCLYDAGVTEAKPVWTTRRFASVFLKCLINFRPCLYDAGMTEAKPVWTTHRLASVFHPWGIYNWLLLYCKQKVLLPFFST